MTELLSKDLLESLGIVLDDATYQLLSGHYEQVLNKRVMQEVINFLEDSKVTELGNVMQYSDETVQGWLVANVPELEQIIEDEIAILLSEIAEHTDEIVT